MSDLKIEEGINPNPSQNGINHANDDDIYAASLIEQLKNGKSKRLKSLTFLVTTFYLIICGGAFYYFNKSNISNLESIFLLLLDQKIQIYVALSLIFVPIFWLIISLIGKVNDLTILSNGLLNAALRLTHPTNSSEKAIKTLGGAIKSEVNQITSSVADAIKRTSDLEKSLSIELENIDETITQSESKLEHTINLLKTQRDELMSSSEIANSDLQKILETIDSRTSHLGSEISSYIDRLIGLEENINEKINLFDDVINKIQNASNTINLNSSEIAENLEQTNNKLLSQTQVIKSTKDELDNSLSNINSMVTSQNTRLDNSITELRNISEKIDLKLINADDLLSNFREVIEPKLLNIFDDLTQDFETKISNVGKETVSKIDDKLREEMKMNNQLSESLMGISSNIDIQIKEQLKKLEEIFYNLQDDTKSTIEDQKFEIEKTFDQKVLEFNAKTKLMSESIKEITIETTDQLNLTINEILKTIKSNFSETSKITDSGLKSIQEKTHQDLIELSSKLIQKSSELGNQTTSTIDKISEDISQKIIQFKNQARNISDELASEISNKTIKLSTEMVDIQSETINKINTEINNLSVEYKENINELVNASASLSEELNITKNIVKRELFELPEEASNYLAKMRNVIEEQISAISKLNKLISDHDNYRDIDTNSNKSPDAPITIEKSKSNEKEIHTQKKRKSRDWFLPEILAPNSRLNEKKQQADNQKLETLENELLDTLKFDYDKVNLILTDKKPSSVWESFYTGEDQVITEKDYSRLGRRLFNSIKTRYSENRNFRSLANKYLKSFEELINNYQKTNDENEISLLLDSESGILFILISHSIGKLD
jgi:hypothetical protein